MVLGATACADPPSISTLFPPGAQRATTAVVELRGTLPQWPLEAVVHQPGLVIQPLEDQGRIEVTVAPQASVGTHLIRFAGSGGASTLVPFLVGPLPETTESEPNDRVSASNPVAVPSTCNGILEKAGDVDSYAIRLEAGQTFIASLDGHGRLASPMDAVLQLTDDRGFVVAQNDDYAGLDPLLVAPIARTGEYRIRVFAFPETPNSSIRFAGGDQYVYRLTVTTGPFLHHVEPLAVSPGSTVGFRGLGWNLSAETSVATVEIPAASTFLVPQEMPARRDLLIPVWEHACLSESDAAESTTPLTAPFTLSGRLATAQEADEYRLAVEEGERLKLEVLSRAIGFPTDPVLVLSDADGNALQKVDDTDRRPDPVLEWQAPATGEYLIAIHDLFERGGSSFAYRLDVLRELPDARVTTTQDRWTVAANGTLEIPLNVERLDAFDGEVHIELVEAPEGVVAEPVVSRAGDDSAGKVTLTLTAGAAGFGPLRFAYRLAPPSSPGEAISEAEHREVTAPAGLHGSPLPHLWLTVIGE